MACAGVKATTLVLLKAGAAPDKVDGLGNTPMHIAEREGNDKVVDLLLEWLPAKEPTPEPEAHPIEPDAGELSLSFSLCLIVSLQLASCSTQLRYQPVLVDTSLGLQALPHCAISCNLVSCTHATLPSQTCSEDQITCSVDEKQVNVSPQGQRGMMWTALRSHLLRAKLPCPPTR